MVFDKIWSVRTNYYHSEKNNNKKHQAENLFPSNVKRAVVNVSTILWLTVSGFTYLLWRLNFDGSNTDGPFTTAVSNSFLNR